MKLKTIAVPLLVLLSSCAKPKPTGAQIDPALSILIPPDTILAVAVHADKLRMTSVYQKYLGGRLTYPGLDQMAHLTGMDPRKDLWQILFLSDAKHNVILGRGNFGDDMELKLEREGAKRTGYKSYYMVGTEEAAVLFFNSTTAAVGSMESLKALLDARGKSNGPPAAIAARMKEIPADAQMWAAYVGGPIRVPFPLSGNLANANNFLEAVRAASFYLDLRDGVKGTVRAQCDSEAGAKTVHDALKAFVGLGRLMAPPNQPELLRVYDGLLITQETNQVNVKIDESPDLIENLLNLGFDRARIGVR